MAKIVRPSWIGGRQRLRVEVAGYGGDIVAYFMRYRDKLKSRQDIRKFSGLSAGDAAVLRLLYP